MEKNLNEERIWYLKNQSPEILKRVLNCLETFIEYLSPYENGNFSGSGSGIKISHTTETIQTMELRGSEDDDEKEKKEEKYLKPIEKEIPRVLSFSNPKRTFEGFVCLDGWIITQAELNIHFSKWNKGQSFNMKITPKNPFHIIQLRHTINFVHEAIRILSQVKRFNENIDKYNVVDAIEYHLRNIFEATEWLDKSVDELLNSDLLATQGVRNPPARSRMFECQHAAEDLFIDFSVNRDELILFVCIAVPLIKSEKLKMLKQSMADIDKSTFLYSDDTSGTVYFLDDSIWMEVLSSSEIHICTPSLSKMTNSLVDASSLLSLLRYNLEALK